MKMPAQRVAPNLTFSEAYHAAQSFLIHIGAPPTKLEEPADGIVEFTGSGYIGRLRYDDWPLSQAAILALLKSIEDDGDTATPILFSPTGFTESAEVFGENLHVALFAIGTDGDMVARTPAARTMLPREPFEPPFTSDESNDETEGRSGIWSPDRPRVADHEWLDCPTCGTTHHPEANFCHRCGAAIAHGGLEPPTGARSSLGAGTGHRAPGDMGTSWRCRACGSSDIEVSDDQPAR